MVNRFISSLCIIALAFVSSALFTIEANAASVDDFPYKKYLKVDTGYYTGNTFEYACLISTGEITTVTVMASDTVENLETGTIVAQGDAEQYYCTTIGYSGDCRAYILVYDPLTGWTAHLPSLRRTSNGSFQAQLLLYPTSRATAYDLPPADFPEFDFDAVQNQIDDINGSIGSLSDQIDSLDSKLDHALNGTTSSSTQAINIQNNITNNYNSYQNGDMSASELRSNVDLMVTMLDIISENEDNTLSDNIAINNALTYAQTVQDMIIADENMAAMQQQIDKLEELIKNTDVTPELADFLASAYEGLSLEYSNFLKYDIPEEECLNWIAETNASILQIIPLYPSVADQTALHTTQQAFYAVQDAIQNSGDIKPSLTKDVEKSNNEEKDYLNDLIKETTSSMQDMSAEEQFKEQERKEANNILSLIWENEILKRLVPISAIFMVVCVVLGIKYRL